MKKQIKTIASAIIFALVLINQTAWSQNWLTALNNGGAADKLGESGNNPLNMYTNNTLKLILTAGGDLNINTSTNGYQINANTVLWHKGHPENIFVGVGAGASTTGLYNTFTGNGAGFTNVGGTKNTFNGYAAGFNTNSHSTGGNDHTFIGYEAGYNNCNGDAEGICQKNTFVGSSSGYSNTFGGLNTFLGAYAGYNNTTNFENVAVGSYALYTQAYSGENFTYNVAVGNEALYYNSPTTTSNGFQNIAVGFRALYSNSTGFNNTASGFQSGYYNQTGQDNAIFGYNAGGFGAGAANSFSSSCFFGSQAGYKNTTGSNNNAFGFDALYNNTGTPNNAFGYQALYSNTTGANNTAIGHQSLYSNSTGSNNTATGYKALNANTSDNNNAYGYQALTTNAGGGDNDAFGTDALQLNLSGSNNCAFGSYALATNSTNNYNSAYGAYSLNSNTADGNSALGYEALKTNSSGAYNTATGYDALKLNSSGLYNTAIGAYALATASTVHENTAVGYQSLQNTTAGNNTAVGYQSLKTNNSGIDNSAIGYAALYKNTSGEQNSAVGLEALFNNTTGYNNTAVGYYAGGAYDGGTYNTFLGSNADANAANYSSASAIGYSAITTASNMMYFGNVNTVLYSHVGVVNASDGRFKNNVTENVKGLAFINKLRPVTYNMDTKALDDFLIQNMPDSMKTSHRKGMDFTASTATVHSGFIAQEVEQTAQQIGFTSSIVSHPPNSNSHYGLNYAEFVVPLVKAVQELSGNGDSLKKVIHKQDSLITKQDSINKALQNQINQIVTNCCTNGTGNRSIQNNNSNGSTGDNKNVGSINVELNNVNAIVLNDAVPNPFAEQTVIGYNIPANFNSAQILFYDSNGQLIKSVDIKTAGKGQLNVFANDLTNGIYSYTLIVDGKIIATKRMIRQQ